MSKVLMIIYFNQNSLLYLLKVSQIIKSHSEMFTIKHHQHNIIYKLNFAHSTFG